MTNQDDRERLTRALNALLEIHAVADMAIPTAASDNDYAAFDHIRGIARREMPDRWQES